MPFLAEMATRSKFSAWRVFQHLTWRTINVAKKLSLVSQPGQFLNHSLNDPRWRINRCQRKNFVRSSRLTRRSWALVPVTLLRLPLRVHLRVGRYMARHLRLMRLPPCLSCKQLPQECRHPLGWSQVRHRFLSSLQEVHLLQGHSQVRHLHSLPPSPVCLVRPVFHLGKSMPRLQGLSDLVQLILTNSFCLVFV